MLIEIERGNISELIGSDKVVGFVSILVDGIVLIDEMIGF